MINSIKNFFNQKNKSSEQYILEHKATVFHFSLKYNENIVGYLKFENNKWYFEYSTWFINQNLLQTIIEFPENNKKYESVELWPFFSNRIPSIKQPKVKKYIENNTKENYSEAKLLEIFGKSSVNNPFKLETE